MKAIAAAGIAFAVASLASAVGCAVSKASAADLGVGSVVGVNPGRIMELGPTDLKPSGHDRLASFSGGCFWGSEDVYRQVPGVVATAVGYTGGTVPNPTYEQVCSHTTGHAETVLVEYDPNKVSYDKLLAVFWDSWDATTPDRQGPDVGSNYRSAIWCYSEDQYRAAKVARSAEQKKWKDPIVTEIHMAKPFYIAEDYHQQFDEKHGTHFCPVGHGS